VEWLGGDGEIKISKRQLRSLAEPLRPHDWMSAPRIRTETGRAEKCKKSIDKSFCIDKYLVAALTAADLWRLAWFRRGGGLCHSALLLVGGC
jgi:hypothetical protein